MYNPLLCKPLLANLLHPYPPLLLPVLLVDHLTLVDPTRLKIGHVRCNPAVRRSALILGDQSTSPFVGDLRRAKRGAFLTKFENSERAKIFEWVSLV